MISISCLESKLLNNNNWYGRFQLAPFQKGEGLTVANALRRTLLAEKSNFFITWVDFYNAEIPYSVLTGMRESIFDILLNLKQVIFTSNKILPNNSHLFKMPENKNFRTQKIVFLGQKKQGSLSRNLIIHQRMYSKISKYLTNSLFSVDNLNKGINKTLKFQNSKNQKSDHKTQNLFYQAKTPPKTLQFRGQLPIFVSQKPKDTAWPVVVLPSDKQHLTNPWGRLLALGTQNQILGKMMNSKNEKFSLVPVEIFPKNTNQTNEILNTYNSKETDNSTYLGYICVKGPATIYAKNIKLPNGLKCVDPNKYIATLADDGLFYLRFALTTEIKTLPFHDTFNRSININKNLKFNTVQLKTFPKTLFNKETQSLLSYKVNSPIRNLQNKSKNFHHLFHMGQKTLDTFPAKSFQIPFVYNNSKQKNHHNSHSKTGLIDTKPSNLGLTLVKQSYMESDNLKIQSTNHSKNLINQQRLLLTNDSIKQLNFQNTSITANIEKTCLLNLQIKHYYYKCGRFDRFLFDLIKPFKPNLKSINYHKPSLNNKETIFFQDSNWKVLNDLTLKWLKGLPITCFQKTLSHQKYNHQAKKLSKTLLLREQLPIVVFQRNKDATLPTASSLSCRWYDSSKNQYFGSLVKWQKIFQSIRTNSIYDYFYKLHTSEATLPFFKLTKPTLINGGERGKISLVRSKLISNSGFKVGSSINTDYSNVWICKLDEPYIQKFLNICFSFQCSKNHILDFLKVYIFEYKNSLNKNSIGIKNWLPRKNHLYENKDYKQLKYEKKKEKLITKIKFLRKCLYLPTKQSNETKSLLFKKKNYLFPLFNRLFLVRRVNLLKFLCENQSQILKYDYHLREFFDSTKSWRDSKKIGLLPTVSILKRLTSFLSGYMLTYSLISLKQTNQSSMCSGFADDSPTIWKRAPRFSFPTIKEGTNNSFLILTNIRRKPLSSIQPISYKPVWIFSCQFKQNRNNLSKWLKNLNLSNIKQAQMNMKVGTNINFFWNSSCFTKEAIQIPFKTKINNSVVLKPIYLNVEQIIYILKQTTKFRKNQRINPIFLNFFNMKNFYPLDYSFKFLKRFSIRRINPFHNSLYASNLFNNIKQTRQFHYMNEKIIIPKKNYTRRLRLACHVWVLGNNFIFKSKYSNYNPPIIHSGQLNYIADKWSGNKAFKNTDAFVFSKALSAPKNLEIFVSSFLDKQTFLAMKKHLIINQHCSLLDVNYPSNIKNWYNEPYNINIYHSKISFNLRYNHPFKYTIFQTCLPFLNFSKKLEDVPKTYLGFSAFSPSEKSLEKKAFLFEIFQTSFFEKFYQFKTTAVDTKDNIKKSSFLAKHRLLYLSSPTQQPKSYFFYNSLPKIDQPKGIFKFNNLIKNYDNFSFFKNQPKVNISGATANHKNYQIIKNNQKHTKVFNCRKNEMLRIISSHDFDYIQYNESFKIYTTLAYACLKTYEPNEKWEPNLSKYYGFNRPNQEKSQKALSSQSFQSLMEAWAPFQNPTNHENDIFNSKSRKSPYTKPSIYKFLNTTNQLPSIFNNLSKWRIMNNSNFNDAFIIIPCNWFLNFQRGCEQLYVLPNSTSLGILTDKEAIPSEGISFLMGLQAAPLKKLFYINFIVACNHFENNPAERDSDNTLFLEENTKIHRSAKNKLHWLKLFKTPPVDSSLSRKRHLSKQWNRLQEDETKQRNSNNYDQTLPVKNDYNSKHFFFLVTCRGLPKFKMKRLGLPPSLKKLAISFENIYYKNFLWNSRKITLRILNNAILPLVINRKYIIYDFIAKKNLQKLPLYSIRHKILGTTNFLCSQVYPSFKNENEIQAQKVAKPDRKVGTSSLVRGTEMSMFEKKLSNRKASSINYNKIETNPFYKPLFVDFTTRKQKSNENSESNVLFNNQAIGSQILIDQSSTLEKFAALRKNRWLQTLIQESFISKNAHPPTSNKNDSKIKSPLISNLWSSSFFCKYSLYAISTRSDLFLQNLINFSGLTDQNVDASIFSQAPLSVLFESQQGEDSQPKSLDPFNNLTPLTQQTDIFQSNLKPYQNNLEKFLFKKMESKVSQSHSDQFLKIKPFLKSSYDKTVQKILKSQHHNPINDFIPNSAFHWQKAVYFAILSEFKRSKLNNKEEKPRLDYSTGLNWYKNQYNNQGSFREFFLQYSKKDVDYNSQNLVNVLLTDNLFVNRRFPKNKHSIQRLKKYERYFGNPLRRNINQKGFNFYTIRLLTKLPKEFTTLTKTNQQMIKSWKSIIYTAEVDIYFVFGYPLFMKNCNLPWQKSKSIFHNTKNWLNTITVNLKPLAKLTFKTTLNRTTLVWRQDNLLKSKTINKSQNISLFRNLQFTSKWRANSTYTQLSSSSNKTHQPLLYNKVLKNFLLPVHMPKENKGFYEMISYFTIKESLNSTYKVNYIVESQASESKSMSELAFYSHQNDRVPRFSNSIEAFHNMKKYENIQNDSVATDSLTVSNFLNGTYSFVPSKTIILNSFNELINSKINKSPIQNENEYIQIDIWTNGALSPRQALLNAFRKLFELFYNLSKYNCLKPIEI